MPRSASAVADLGSVAQHGGGWRARVKLNRLNVEGPTRATHTEAQADLHHARQSASREEMQQMLKSLTSTSMLALEDLPRTANADKRGNGNVVKAVARLGSVTQHGRAWRAKVQLGRLNVNGPTRATHDEAQADLDQARQCASREEMKQMLESLAPTPLLASTDLPRTTDADKEVESTAAQSNPTQGCSLQSGAEARVPQAWVGSCFSFACRFAVPGQWAALSSI